MAEVVDPPSMELVEPAGQLAAEPSVPVGIFPFGVAFASFPLHGQFVVVAMPTVPVDTPV